MAWDRSLSFGELRHLILNTGPLYPGDSLSLPLSLCLLFFFSPDCAIGYLMLRPFSPELGRAKTDQMAPYFANCTPRPLSLSLTRTLSLTLSPSRSLSAGGTEPVRDGTLLRVGDAADRPEHHGDADLRGGELPPMFPYWLQVHLQPRTTRQIYEDLLQEEVRPSRASSSNAVWIAQWRTAILSWGDLRVGRIGRAGLPGGHCFSLSLYSLLPPVPINDPGCLSDFKNTRSSQLLLADLFAVRMGRACLCQPCHSSRFKLMQFI